VLTADPDLQCRFDATGRLEGHANQSSNPDALQPFLLYYLIDSVRRFEVGPLRLERPETAQAVLLLCIVGTASILGVIVDVKREILPGRARRASQRDVIAALEEEMPELLGELEL
jgi:hypothetical protein